jgi:hypothetical protein
MHHFLLLAVFSKVLWDKVAQAFQVHPVVLPFQKGTVQDWLSAITRAGARKHQCENACIIFFFWRFIWKERNNIVFKGKESFFLQVTELIKDAIIN